MLDTLLCSLVAGVGGWKIREFFINREAERNSNLGQFNNHVMSPFPERCGCTHSPDYFAYSNSPEALRGMNTSRLHPNPPQALIDMHEAMQRAAELFHEQCQRDMDKGRKDN